MKKKRAKHWVLRCGTLYLRSWDYHGYVKTTAHLDRAHKFPTRREAKRFASTRPEFRAEAVR